MARQNIAGTRPRLWWRDDISPAQREAIKRLAETATGCGHASDFKGVRLSTFRALHRLGLVKPGVGMEFRTTTIAHITESGRAAVVPSQTKT